MKFSAAAITASVLVVAASAPAYGSAVKRNAFTVGCNDAQADAVSQAVADAQGMVQDALTYTGGVNTATPRYTQWFGAFEPGRRAEVMNTFSRMMNDANSVMSDYDCSTPCNDSTAFAESNPNESYKIRLCPAFWSAPPTGTDSKAGTIVRQLSTFTDNGGKLGTAVGQADSHSLAVSNPGAAILNADSYEYYAENTPFLP